VDGSFHAAISTKEVDMLRIRRYKFSSLLGGLIAETSAGNMPNAERGPGATRGRSVFGFSKARNFISS
jgi:hypothetical protein